MWFPACGHCKEIGSCRGSTRSRHENSRGNYKQCLLSESAELESHKCPLPRETARGAGGPLAEAAKYVSGEVKAGARPGHQLPPLSQCPAEKGLLKGRLALEKMSTSLSAEGRHLFHHHQMAFGPKLQTSHVDPYSLRLSSPPLPGERVSPLPFLSGLLAPLPSSTCLLCEGDTVWISAFHCCRLGILDPFGFSNFNSFQA